MENDIINEARINRKRILFEGAQGLLLDIDHGTYPYVTSSNTLPSTASTGSGVSVKNLGFILGIVKAYNTRVGSGPFPSELKNDIGERIGNIGGEIGATTGRIRRCGWLDLKVLKKLFSFAKPYMYQFWILVFLTISLAAIVPLRPYIVGIIIDNQIASVDYEGLIHMIVLLLGLLLLQSIVQYSHTFLSGVLGQFRY